MTIRTLSVMTITALAAANGFGAGKGAFFVMRFDDNKPVKEWREVAEIFEEQGIRCSFAVNPASLKPEQAACLRELAAKGHEIMDHTASHSMYALKDERGETVRFDPVVDRDNARNFRFTAAIKGGRLICSDEKAVKKIGYSGKFYVPSIDKVYGLGKRGKWGELGTAPEWYIAGFWGGEVEDVPEQEMLALDRTAVKPSEATLRTQAEYSVKRFKELGLPQPRTWIQPGGWETPQAAETLSAVYSRYGYRAADCYIGAGPLQWRFQSNFNYFDVNQSVSQVCARVERAIKAGRPFAYISHQRLGLPGGRQEFLQRTREFAKWLKDNRIPCATYSAIADFSE